MIHYDFSGQNVVVTGGTRGIGRAVSTAFLNAGARVAAIYASNDAAAQEFQAGMGATGARLVLRKCDVGDYAQVENLFRDLETVFETGPQIVVNNSGIRKDAVLAMMKADDWNAVVRVNLSGTFHVSKFAVLAMMRKRYGRIINITSPCGQFGFEGQANYAASKAGQVALTRSLSKEVATRGITINCVSPGFITTDLLADLPEKLREQYQQQVPLKKFGTPEDVANCVLFLAAKQSGYITGMTLDVTGGL